MYASGTCLFRLNDVVTGHGFLSSEGGNSDCRSAKLQRNYSQIWIQREWIFLNANVLFRIRFANDIIISAAI